MALKDECAIICIDGGGTKTNGVLFTGNEIRAKIKSGTTRIGAVGVGESCERTLNVILELCNQAGINTSEVDCIVVGLAGVWLEGEKMRSLNLIKTLARGQGHAINDLVVTSDAEIALEGAFNGKKGIITIVGTGSIGLARYDKNKLARCGGWGIELDDEGSGAWVGREGITAVVRALDGRGKPTVLSQKLTEIVPAFDIDEPRTIVKAYNDKTFEYQSVTPLVMECASLNDEVCFDIMNRAAKHLSELPVSLLKYFKNKVDVALMGGIIDNDTLLSRMLRSELSKHKELNIIHPKGDAIEGAKVIAMRVIEELQK